MSLHLTDTTTYLHRTTGINTSGDWSWCIWYRPDIDVPIGKYTTVIAKIDAGYANDIGVYSKADGTNSYYLDIFNGIDHASTGKVLTAGTWYPISYIKIGTAHRFYVGSIFIDIITNDTSAITFNQMFLGGDSTATSFSNGTFVYFREWDAALTVDEMRREFNSKTVVRTANLRTNTPFTADINDISGNNYNWTAVGTGYSVSASDPIPDGTSVDQAIDIGTLPYNASFTAGFSTIYFQFNYWFKYTAVDPEIYIGGWFFGDLVNYQPQTDIYSDAGITPYPPNNPISDVNRRFQMPVTPGNTYWFRAGILGAVTITTGTLLVDFLTAPRESVPKGSGFVNDDTLDYYSAVFSSLPSDDYHILRFFPFIVTDPESGGDVSLNNGNILVDNNFTSIDLYDSQLTFLLNTGVDISASSDIISIRSSPTGANFYVTAGGGTDKVWIISKVGVVVSILNINNPTSAAPNVAETIIYMQAIGSTNNAPVRRWDVGTAAFIADLAPGQGVGWFTGDMLVLPDDTLLVMYGNNAPNALKVIRYNSSGTILNTYNLGDCDSGNMAFDVFEPSTYFWVRVQNLGIDGTCNIMKIRISDGAVIVNNKHVVYLAGVYQAPKTATPLAKFGVSFSCPFFPLVEAIDIPIPPTTGPPLTTMPPLTTPTPKHTDSIAGGIELTIPTPQFKTALLGN